MSSARLNETYKFFCNTNGNQNIASEFSIIKLQNLIHRFKITTVLEVGLGIGAVVGSLLAINKGLKYSGTEKNQFCLDALKNNLNGNYGRLEIFAELSEIPPKKFDLIIIDGTDSGLSKIQQLITTYGIIVIEGDRYPQQKLLMQFFPHHKVVHSISTKKNRGYSPFPSHHWQGGLKIIFINPDLFQKMWWLKEKVSTKFKILLRTRLNR